MNRELRRLQEKEDKRARERRDCPGSGSAAARSAWGSASSFSEVRTELKRVAWPSRREVTTFTLVTLITSGFVTLYVLALDIGFKEGVLQLLALR